MILLILLSSSKFLYIFNFLKTKDYYWKIFLRDEGIVIKDLGSKWEPGDRSGKWLKLKPDYVRAGSDLDALIIGLKFSCFSVCLDKHISY